MVMVNINEAKTHLSHYAKRVKAGETIILCDRNVPFAELRPISAPKGVPGANLVNSKDSVRLAKSSLLVIKKSRKDSRTRSSLPAPDREHPARYVHLPVDD